MARVKTRPDQSEQYSIQAQRRAYYSLERFLDPLSERTAALLRKAWAENDVLVVKQLPSDAIAVVLIMAGYGYAHEIAIVDDWQLLCERYEEGIRLGTCLHPDGWFASCIVINWRNNRPTHLATYHELGIHRHWNALTGAPLENTP